MKNNQNDQLNQDKSGSRSNQKPAEVSNKSKNQPVKKDKQESGDHEEQNNSGDSRTQQSESKTGKKNL